MKQLSDEQIRAASLDAGMQEHYMDFHSGFIRFAHAIEARVLAGITGDGRGEAAPKATMFHDAGAIAQCGKCGRYTLDRKALSDRQPICTCGEQHYWSGSFKPPTEDSIWHGPAPSTPPQQEQAALGAVQDDLLKRAVDLHEMAGMPWAEAEKLALSESGIEDRHIDELTGNTDHATICSLLSEEEIREFTRTILIYGQPLLAAAPKAQEPGA